MDKTDKLITRKTRATMIKFIKKLFLLEKKPSKGLLAAEWIMLAYMLFTIVFMALNYSKLTHPGEMIWGRGCILVITAVLWGLYRILPCRLTRFLRIAIQLAFLGWWYPDTYELNRVLPNLDHVFAQWEQSIFGLQPALVFHQTFSSPVFSEMMDMGYASYYPMILLVTLFYFLFRYNEFEKAAFVILTSFFIFYVIFVLVPVTGPTFYFKAVGIDNIVNGVFPNVNDYFNTHQECLPSPGHHDGLFYKMVEGAKQAGERPTAAFPSSHVGITTVLVLLAWHTGNRKFFWLLVPFFTLMFFATVYIQAHYAIDAIAGLFTGALFYYTLMATGKRMGMK